MRKTDIFSKYIAINECGTSPFDVNGEVPIQIMTIILDSLLTVDLTILYANSFPQVIFINDDREI